MQSMPHRFWVQLDGFLLWTQMISLRFCRTALTCLKNTPVSRFCWSEASVYLCCSQIYMLTEKTEVWGTLQMWPQWCCRCLTGISAELRLFKFRAPASAGSKCLLWSHLSAAGNNWTRNCYVKNCLLLHSICLSLVLSS